MRTTVDLPEPLLRNAKKRADQRGVTLSTVISDALRSHLAAKSGPAAGTFKLLTVRGRLVHPELDLDRTSALLIEDDERTYRKS